MSLYHIVKRLEAENIEIVDRDEPLDPGLDSELVLNKGIRIHVSEHHRPKYRVFGPGVFEQCSSAAAVVAVVKPLVQETK